MMLLQVNPLLPIWQYGAATGSAFICVGLFIWSQIQIATFKTMIEGHTKVITESNQELKKLIEAQSVAQSRLVDSVQQLIEGIRVQAEAHHEQLNLLREMVSDQKVLSANQLTTMNGFQRVVEQLISALRSGGD
jgi:hypothetical protein